MAFKDDGRFYPIAECPFKGPKTAGRLDLLSYIYGEWAGVVFDGTFVVDYKTGKKPASKGGYPEWPLQLSLYREGADRTLGIKADGQVIFHLDKFTGIPTPHDYSATYEADLETALALVEFYWLFRKEYIDRNQAGGAAVPSVTTILKVLDKPALVQWAANCTCDYIREKLETKVSVSKSDLEAMLNDARFNFRKVSETAMDVGTRVHDLIEKYHVTGKEPTRRELFNKQVKAGWDAFMDMWTSLETEVVKVEARIFC